MAFLAIKIIKLFIFFIILWIGNYYFIFNKESVRSFYASLFGAGVLFFVDIFFPTLFVYYYRRF